MALARLFHAGRTSVADHRLVALHRFVLAPRLSTCFSSAKRIRPTSQPTYRSRYNSNRDDQSDKSKQMVIKPPLNPFRKDTGSYDYFSSRQSVPFYKNKRMLIYCAIGLGFAGVYYVVHLERVPYSNRRRYMDISKYEASTNVLLSTAYQVIIIYHDS
jgi:hypothetical protein